MEQPRMIRALLEKVTPTRPAAFLPRPDRAVASIDGHHPDVTVSTYREAEGILGGTVEVMTAITSRELLLLPAACTPDDARALFTDYALVSSNGVAVIAHQGANVDLVGDHGPVRVSSLLYEVLRRSITGTSTIPDVVDRVARTADVDPNPILLEVVRRLRALLESGTVTLRVADTENAPERITLTPVS